MSSPTAPDRRRRQPAVVALDLIASVAILAFALVFGLVMLQFVNQLYGFSASCAADASLGCNTALLGVATYGLLGVTVIVFVLGLGMAIVKVIQRRYTIFWTFGALVIMILAFYAASYLTGQAVPSA